MDTLRFIPPGHPKTQGVCERAVEKDPWQLKDVLYHFKTEKMCERAVEAGYSKFDPGHFKTGKMCGKVVCMEPCNLEYVPDHFNTEEMCDEAVRRRPCTIEFIPDHFKTQEMCDKAVKDDTSSLQFLPDCFITRGWVNMWYDNYYDDDYYDDYEDKFFKWFDGYKKLKVRRASIKEELLPIAWHPSRHWDWCMSEEEKKDTEKLWA